MAGNSDNDFDTIEVRNALRAEAQMPLLDVQAELRRLEAVREQADFERRRHQCGHLWDRNSFWTKMATYNRVRQSREEFRGGRT
jgi:hypothetical protein